jgi:hypothetical protein
VDENVGMDFLLDDWSEVVLGFFDFIFHFAYTDIRISRGFGYEKTLTDESRLR